MLLWCSSIPESAHPEYVMLELGCLSDATHLQPMQLSVSHAPKVCVFLAVTLFQPKGEHCRSVFLFGLQLRAKTEIPCKLLHKRSIGRTHAQMYKHGMRVQLCKGDQKSGGLARALLLLSPCGAGRLSIRESDCDVSV